MKKLVFDLGNILVRLNSVDVFWTGSDRKKEDIKDSSGKVYTNQSNKHNQTPNFRQTTEINQKDYDLADDQKTIQKINLSKLSYNQRWGKSQAIKDYEEGRIENFGLFYERLRKELDITLSYDAFQHYFLEIIGPAYEETKPMLEVLSSNYDLYLLSNTNQAHWELVRKRDGLNQYFKKCFLSHEIGSMKPDHKIYQALLNEVGGDPENIYYFDDKKENIDAGTMLGINSFQIMGGKPLIRLLKELKLIR